MNEACTLAEIANPTNVITDDGIVIELIDEQKTVGEDSKNDIFDVIDTIQCKEEQNVQFDTVDGTAILGAMNGFGAGNVTRLSTIVEILKILFQNFIDKNPINCISLHKFSLFYLNFYHFHNFFFAFLLQKINNF